MLHLHFANRYETLSELLLGRLAAGRGNVFAADAVMVPSSAVRRALTLALADRHGVCANVEFNYLAQWLWQQVARLLPGVGAESPFAPAVLAWRVYAALGDAEFVAGHRRLAGYLQDADEVMRYELALRVAGLLDQTLTYRPDWLRAWAKGQNADIGSERDTALADQAWQRALWQRILAQLGPDAKPPDQAFAAALRQGETALGAMRQGDTAFATRREGHVALNRLPPQAHVFALPTMAPLHLHMLQQLGRHMALHVYVLNPCREYWFELIAPGRLAHLAARGRDAGHEVGHRLLAAWGRQTQAHIDLLVEAGGETVSQSDHFEPHPGSHLLARLQNSLLDLAELEPGSVTLAADDRSIELHVCHSLTRELEVLQDHLLGLFARDGGLQASQIVVLTPDLEAAAPLIDAVFGGAPPERRMAFTISGRARSRVNAPAGLLLALLRLLGSRMASSEVFAFLQQPLVARRFSLDDAGLEQIHAWLGQAGVHWALDADHRGQFDVPAQARHSWADALDRLFLGYALPSQVSKPLALHPCGAEPGAEQDLERGTGEATDLLPAGDAEGGDAAALGRLWQFMARLTRLHRALARPLPAADWADAMQGACADFMLAQGDEINDLSELRATLRALADEMHSGAPDAAVPLAVWRHALEQRLDDPARGGVPSGGVTFSALSSLRLLPYAVVCLIGLDDGVFPSAHRASEFDLLALAPQRGDRQRRHDERNLFLDLLLAARQSLYLSHCGRGQRDNAPLPPSVLVSELLETLIPAIASDPSDEASLARARARLVVEHPLQPFASEGFSASADPRLRSHNRELGDALRASLLAAQGAAQVGAGAAKRLEKTLAAQSVNDDSDVEHADEAEDSDDSDPAEPWSSDQTRFFRTPLPEPDAAWRRVSAAQLIRFLRNPCRTLLAQRMKIAVGAAADELQDVEPLLPDWQGRKALAARLLPALLQGQSLSAVRCLALAGVEMPQGALGANEIERELDSLHRFAQRVREASGSACLPPHGVVLDLALDGEPWQLHTEFADLRPEGLLSWRFDALRPGDRLEAWVRHLLLCAQPAAGAAARSLRLATDTDLALRAADDPRALLVDLLRLYRDGLRQPSHFFPKSAWAYVENGESLLAARRIWAVTPFKPHGEGADAAYRLALRGAGDPLDLDFCKLALRVYRPLIEHQDAVAAVAS